jgi:hypothetical protein
LEALTISLGNTPVLVTFHFYNSVKKSTGIIRGNKKCLLQGLILHPYYTMLQSKSLITVYVSSSRQWLGLEKDAKIAVFLPLPPETSPQIYFIQPILHQRPLATIYIRGIDFCGLLDTGADQSVIPQSLWPKHWGTKRGTTIQGVGGPQLAKVSAEVLR